MNLNKFYKNVENIIIDDLIINLLKIKPTKKIKILNIYLSDIKHLDDKNVNDRNSTINMGIGNDSNLFIKNLLEYYNALNGQKFDIINCKFSIKHFLINLNDFFQFIGFIANNLKIGGYFMGFLLDTNKVDGLFAEKGYYSRGPFSIEYITDYENPDNTFRPLIINGELVNTINFSTLNMLCKKFGLIHMSNVILDSIYRNSLYDIKLNEYEKKFGFLNYVFIFKKL